MHVHRPFAGKERNPKNTLQSLYTLLKREVNCGKMTKWVRVGFELLGVVNFGWVYM